MRKFTFLNRKNSRKCVLIMFVLLIGFCVTMGTFTGLARAQSSSDYPPAPKPTDYCNESQSLPCKMINERYQFLNNANQSGYFYGFVQGMTEPTVLYVVKGSVFPVNDMVTPSDYQEVCTGGGTGECNVVLQRQQPDGTWGTNGEAMFGWTASGIYFEWSGPYAYSAHPLTFQPLEVVK